MVGALRPRLARPTNMRPSKLRWRWTLHVLAISTIVLTAQVLPWRLAAVGAVAWYRGAPDQQLALARGVRRWLEAGLDHQSYTTGQRRYDGEWLFGTHVMAALGFGQLADRRPEVRAEMLAAMDLCLERLIQPSQTAYDAEAWGVEPLEALEDDRGHVAYLGYTNVALSLRRTLELEGRYAELNDALSEALLRRYRRELLPETYPGERYPVDNSAAIASLALRARALGRPPPSEVRAWLDALEARYRDPASGLLVQSVGPDGHPADRPRASGTALAAYFLAFVDDALARDLYLSLERSVGGDVLGFGAMREYPRGHRGAGDIDSGPVLLGFSISGTGFALSSARRWGSPERFAALMATTQLFGVPRRRGEVLHFALGGPLGDAILLAMLTAGGSH